MDKPLTFLKEVQVELNKVVWPTREQTIKLTLVVILVTVGVGLFVGGVDFLLAQVANLLYK